MFNRTGSRAHGELLFSRHSGSVNAGGGDHRTTRRLASRTRRRFDGSDPIGRGGDLGDLSHVHHLGPERFSLFVEAFSSACPVARELLFREKLVLRDSENKGVDATLLRCFGLVTSKAKHSS
jgi:hypothetical protein